MARLSASDLLGFHASLSRRELAWALLPVACALLLACFPVYSGDIWMHLASARLMVQTGSIPTQDVFLYTAQGNPWIDHSWGAQLLFYGAYKLGTANALVLTRMALAALAAFLFWRLAVARGALPWIAACCTAGLIGIAAPQFITRPLMLAPICAAGILLCLAQPTRARVVWALLIQLVWANLHASFILGLAILGSAAVDATLWHVWHRSRETSETKSPASAQAGLAWHWLWGALVLGGLICLVNPYGVGLYRYVIDLRQLTWVQKVIEEWRPPEFWRPENMRFAAASLLVWGLVIAALLRRRALCLTDLLLLVVFTWQAYASRRFILLFAFLAMAPMALAIHRLLPRRQRLHVLCGILLASLAAYVGLETLVPRLRLGHLRLGINTKIVPARAVDFLAENGVQGNVACAQYAGGYLLWTQYPRMRPATDGRCLVNDPDTIAAFNALGLGRSGWEKAFPPTGVSDVMLLENSYHTTPLHRLRTVWRVVYYDDKWVIWMRRGGTYDAVIDKHDITEASPNVLQHVYGDASDKEKQTIKHQLEQRIQQAPSGVAYSLLGYTHYVDAVILLSRASRLEATLRKTGTRGDPAQRQRLQQQANKTEAQANQALLHSIRMFDADLLLNPGEQRALFAEARSLVWLLRPQAARTLFTAAAQQDPVNWLEAAIGVEYAAESLDALFGRQAPKVQQTKALRDWLRDNARQQSAQIRRRFRDQGRESELPAWLRQD